VSDVACNATDGGLVEVALEAVADTANHVADVHAVVIDDDVALQGIETERLVRHNIAQIQVQIKGLDESAAASTSEDQFLKRLHLGILDGTADDFQG